MAVTKVYAVRNNLHHSVDYAVNEEKTSLDNIISYAANPNKTEKRLFESMINCSNIQNAYKEMIETKKKYGKEDKVLAYHYIQSFKPGEVTPELAHKIGVEFAKECFGDRFEVVIGTHLDRKHIHNHIVVNSVSFIDGGKLRSTPESYYNQIRKISDRLCAENELSVIAEPQRKGMHYAEWKALSENKPTIRGQIRAELDEIILQSKTMIHFYELLRKNGYQVRNRKYTAEQIISYQNEQEDKIKALVEERKPLYAERKNADETEEISKRIFQINDELKICRAAVRLCKSISEDAQRIAGKYEQVQKISAEEMKKEARKYEHKRRSR